MNRLLRLISGVAVLVIGAFLSFGALVNAFDGHPQMSSVNGTVVNILFSILIFLSLVAAYLLISDAIKSK